MTGQGTHSGVEVIAALAEATNAHDIDAFVALFAKDYDSRQPAHPDRAFVGREQVRTNWTAIFAGAPDFSAELLGSTRDGDTVWTEWEMSGERVDGARHSMRGVVVFTVRAGLASAARFYLEPVDEASLDPDSALRAIVSR